MTTTAFGTKIQLAGFAIMVGSASKEQLSTMHDFCVTLENKLKATPEGQAYLTSYQPSAESVDLTDNVDFQKVFDYGDQLDKLSPGWEVGLVWEKPAIETQSHRRAAHTTKSAGK